MSKCVLIVEDDGLIAIDLAERVGGHGFDVLGPAGSIEEALTLIEQHRPDAALLDADLHGKSSAPVAERLADLGVPLAFCTGYDKISGVSARLQSALLVRKPIAEDALLNALNILTR